MEEMAKVAFITTSLFLFRTVPMDPMTTEFLGILTSELSDNPVCLLCSVGEKLSETVSKGKSDTDLRDERKSARLLSGESCSLLETMSLNEGVTHLVAKNLASKY